MQATLLSIAIALILALVAALVGPHFVDWNKYRSEFETQASRMTGLQVRLAGPIEARLLPTPSISLQRIDVMRPGDVGSLRARKLSIEFSLASLVRGEWKATDVRLEGAELSVVIDRDGQLEWPAPAISFDPESISIERLDITESRALLADAASGSSAVLDKLDFKGELRTLAGPVKGQGSFYLAGLHYPFRINASRTGDGHVRVRLNVDPIDRPVTADVEGVVSVEDGKPRYVGNVTLARPVTRAPAGSQAEIIEPWRLTAKVDGNSTRAVIEQIEFQYGPDERPIRLRGDARMALGAAPRVIGVLSSPQVDLDRILALPEPLRRRPIAAIRSFADYFTGSQRLPIPVDLGVTIENLTLAGASLQRFTGDFSTEGDGWTIKNLELRAPGLTQVVMAGNFGLAGGGLTFAGRTKVDSKDPRTLIAWLTDRSDAQTIAATSLSVDGNFKLGSDEIAVDQLKAELDRMSVEGRLSYAWGTADRPPRIEAVVSAPEIDLDRAHGLLQGLFDGTVFDWPRQGMVSASIDRARLAGVEALRTNVSLRFNTQGLDVERLAIGDFDGVAIAMKGNIDTRGQAPRGTLALDLDASRLDGVAALIERFSPQVAAEVRRNAKRIAPARLNVMLNVAAAPTSVSQSSGQFKVAGSAGAFLVSLHGEIGASSEHLTITDLWRLRSSKVDIGGEIAARDGGALGALLGLDTLVAIDKGDARLTLAARGALDGDMEVEASLLAGGLDVAATGSARLAGSQGPTAGMDVKVAKASIRVPRASGNPVTTLPAVLTARLSLAEGVVGLTDLSGQLAGTEVGGRLTIGFGDPVSIGGELALGAANLPLAITTAIGLPQPPSAAWPSEPFERGLVGAIDGSIKLRIGQLVLGPRLNVQEMRGLLQFGDSSIGLHEIDGSIAGGRVAGNFSFEREAEGLTLGSHLRLAGVNIGELLPDPDALKGRLTVDLDLNGTGRSAIALIGSLRGEGTFTLQDGLIMRIDPSVFNAVTRSVDTGLPIDINRIRERTEAALSSGALPVALAQGEIAIVAGQLRLANTAVQVKGADLGVRMSVDLADNTMDARLSLAGFANGGPEGVRPEIILTVRGPIAAPRRTLDVASFTNWLALRAIEDKDKRIDALQSGRDALLTSAAPSDAAPAPSSAPAVAPAVTAAPAVVAPVAAPAAVLAPGPVAAPAVPFLDVPAAPAVAPTAAPPPERVVTPEEPKQRAAPRPPVAKASPPPTDIRPAPSAKATQPARQQAQQPAQQTQPARPASRSWLENLFGP